MCRWKLPKPVYVWAFFGVIVASLSACLHRVFRRREHEPVSITDGETTRTSNADLEALKDRIDENITEHERALEEHTTRIQSLREQIDADEQKRQALAKENP